jgi:transmembrane protein 17
MAKQTLEKVSETVFPGITSAYGARSKLAERRLGHEIVSNLPLQMCLFFNMCYFPFWLVVAIIITYVKYQYLNYLYKFILITVLVAAITIEIIRLYLGYLGNLTEKVSCVMPKCRQST